MADTSGSLRTILFALAANASIAVAKAGAAFVTGSGAMFAEAIHSAADAGNQLLLLLGIKLAKRPPSMDFPLGYGKEVYFWSFIVAVMLFPVDFFFFSKFLRVTQAEEIIGQDVYKRVELMGKNKSELGVTTFDHI